MMFPSRIALAAWLVTSGLAGACGEALAQADYVPRRMQEEMDTLAPPEVARTPKTPDSPEMSEDEPSRGAKPDLLLAPIPVSTPALGTGAMAAAVLYYNPNNAPDPWVTGGGIGYTSTDTWGGGIFHKMSLDNDRYRIEALGGYGDVRSNFYGIGANLGQAGISVDLRNKGTYAYLDGQMRFFDKGLLSHVHAGVRVSYLKVNSRISIPTPNHPELELPSLELDSHVSAIGPSFTFDTRDHPFTPHKGVLVTGNWMFGAGFLGSDFEYRKLELLSTGFFPLGKDTVLAVRKTACSASSGAPFYDLCQFGRHADLRGYEAGRYRDGATWAFQLEVRQKVWRKFGVVGFAGVGGIAESSKAIWKHSYVLASGGAGVRYLASEANNVNLRFDVAFGRDGTALYFGIGEAF